jgi:hypothetical protein
VAARNPFPPWTCSCTLATTGKEPCPSLLIPPQYDTSGGGAIRALGRRTMFSPTGASLLRVTTSLVSGGGRRRPGRVFCDGRSGLDGE